MGGGDAEPLRVPVPPQLLSQATVAHLKQILADHPGGAAVYLHLGERQVVRLPEQWNVDTSNGLLGQLKVVLERARSWCDANAARGVGYRSCTCRAI